MRLLCVISFAPLAWAKASYLKGSLVVDNDINRDLQSQCDSVMNTLGLDLNLPFVPECSCRLSFFSFQWDCRADICPTELVQSIGTSWNSTTSMPFDDCLSPTLQGTYSTRSRQLETKSCTGSKNVMFNLSAIAEEAGIPTLTASLTPVIAPQICTTLQHKPSELSSVDSCTVTLDDQSCPCQVCEGGKMIRLQCQDLLASYLPGVPASVMAKTTQCFGLDALGAGPFADRVQELANEFLHRI